MARFNEKLSLADVFFQSMKYYRSKVDNKALRAKADIRSAKIINKNNFEYNRSTKEWEQTGRSSKLVIEVRSKPVSYKTIDTISLHKYPITFEFKDIFMGAETPFKWREGGLKKPIFKIPTKGAVDVANANIRNGTQLQFFFEMEMTAKMNNLLWGVCRANRPATKANPKGLIYFGKHAFYTVKKLIIPLINSGKLNQRVIKN